MAQQTKQLPPPCPYCNSVDEREGEKHTREPMGNREYGSMLAFRCTFIADSDWCVVCKKCRLHMHLPGREVKK